MDSSNLNHYKQIDTCYWETLHPLIFYKKTHIVDQIIPSKIKYIDDFKTWLPVITVLIVPAGTKVSLVILKKKIQICRAEQAFVKEQFLNHHIDHNIDQSLSFFDDSFIYKTNTLVKVKNLENKSGIYMYCNMIDAKCH